MHIPREAPSSPKPKAVPVAQCPKIDRKSWALGFDDGVDEALRIIIERLDPNILWSEEIVRISVQNHCKEIIDAINKLKGKHNGQQAN